MIISIIFVKNVLAESSYRRDLPLMTLNQDTAKYLQENILAHKERFQNRSLNNILNELKLPVKSYIVSFGRKVGTIKGVSLIFENFHNASEKLHQHKSVHSLFVEFETPVSSAAAARLLKVSNGNWLTGESELYGPLIIKNITGPHGK